MRTMWTLPGTGLALATLIWAAPSLKAEDEKKPEKPAPQPSIQIQVEAEAEAGPGEGGQRRFQRRNQPASHYWLGLECYPVPPSVRAQIDLPEDTGLLVGGVVDDSPAAKAGVKEHDILLKAGDKDLKQVQDLVSQIEESKDKSITLSLLRGGKQKSVDITPAKRPENQRFGQGLPPGFPQGLPQGANNEEIQKLVERMREQMGPDGQFRMHLFGPGMVVGQDAIGHLMNDHKPLPKNMSISIQKQGDEPAKIEVKQGDKSWTTTEDKLGDLPEDVRGHVEELLGRHRGQAMFALPLPGPGGPNPADHFRPNLHVNPPGGERPEMRLEQRLDELQRRVQEMREEVKEFRNHRRPDRPDRPEKPAPSPERDANKT